MTQTPTPRREPEKGATTLAGDALLDSLDLRDDPSLLRAIAMVLAIESEAVRQALSELEEEVGGLHGQWVAARDYPGDQHGIDYVDRAAVIELIHKKGADL